MEADKKYLADLVATCEQKATDFESRQQLVASAGPSLGGSVKGLTQGAERWVRRPKRGVVRTPHQIRPHRVVTAGCGSRLSPTSELRESVEPSPASFSGDPLSGVRS